MLYALLRREFVEGRVTEIKGFIDTLHRKGPVVFSPHTTSIALAGSPRDRVELWDFQSKKLSSLQSPFNTELMPADVIAFSQDGRLLAVYYQGRGIAVWDTRALSERSHIPVTGGEFVKSMTFADGGASLVAILGRISAPVGGRPLGVGAVALYPDSYARWEVSAGREKEKRAFDPDLFVGPLSPGGRYVVVPGNPPFALDMATGKKAFDCGGSDMFCFSVDGSALLGYDGETAIVWAVPGGRELRRFALEPPGWPHRSWTYGHCISLSPNKRLMAVGRFGGTSGVAVVSLESGRVLDTFTCCDPLMVCRIVCFSADGRILATDTDAVNTEDRRVDPALRFWRIPATW